MDSLLCLSIPALNYACVGNEICVRAHKSSFESETGNLTAVPL
jgi:hypothetical protein